MKQEKENLNLMSDEVLLTKTRFLAAESHRITAELLRYLAVVEKRALFAPLGYSSLFEYVTLELGFAGGSAQRRIEAMRLAQELPEVQEKIESGALSLTNAAQARKFFKQERKNRKPLTKAEKSEIVEKLEGKSTREAEKELASLSSNPVEFLSRDRIRPVAENYSEIRFLADQALVDQLGEIRDLLSHTNPSVNHPSLKAEA